MKNKKAFGLLQKYLDGKATLEEKALIDKWYDSLDPTESIKIVGDPDGVKSKLYHKILAELNAKNKEEKTLVVPLYRKTIFRVAAAVIFIVLSVSAFLLFNNKQSHQLAEIQKYQLPKQDIAPGGNRATLTLANGSTIILDNAQNGSLAIQGNTQVVKLKDGKLIYQKENNTPATIQYNTITTPRGGQYQLTLADGSQVWLNAASSITFPTSFVGDKREVKITGEAYFEVAHNANMPFHVSLNDVEVQVLGTHFNVNAYEDEGDIKTTLLQGSVKVSKGNENVLIKPGEQAQIATNIKVLKNVNLENVIAWKNRYFLLSGTSLESLMRQVSRWYDIDVFYDGKVPNKKFGGSISYNVNLSTVLKALKESSISSRLNGKKLILSE